MKLKIKILFVSLLISCSFRVYGSEWEPISASGIHFPVTYNSEVETWIKYFRGPAKERVQTWLEKSHQHFPRMREQFREAGLPADLAYVTLIESGLIPGATSHASAVGPWQFIEETGRRHGLRYNWWLDERRDFEKSTFAAVKYFKTLYSKFEDWQLALAAYNMGENGLARRMKSNGKLDFWSVRPHLPLETQNYVPQFLAILYIAHNPKHFGFHSVHRAPSIEVEKINVKGGTELAQIADTLGLTRSYLKNLNAELVRGMVPATQIHHEIRVPKGAGIYLKRFKPSILADL